MTMPIQKTAPARTAQISDGGSDRKLAGAFKSGEPGDGALVKATVAKTER